MKKVLKSPTVGARSGKATTRTRHGGGGKPSASRHQTGLEPGRSITWPIKRRQSGGGGTRQSRWRRVLNMRREEEPPDTAPAYSEEALALLFAQRHAARRRYVSAWNKWFSFDGKQWTVDETRETWSLARNLCREASRGVNKPREAKSIANAKTRAAVVSLAGEDRRLAATVDQWDADPWLLNTPGGVIDLRTGERRDHRAEDYMTKITAVCSGCFLSDPALASLSHHSDAQRQGTSGISCKGDRLRAHRSDDRARAVLPPRRRRQRQRCLHEHDRQRPRRLPPHRSHRGVHGDQQRAASNPARHAARRAAGHRN